MEGQKGDSGPGSQSLPPGKDQELGFLSIGVIRGAWGLRGEVRVGVITDFPERFSPGEKVYLDGRPMTVEASHLSGGDFILKLSGLSDCEEADGLKGRYLEIPRSQVAPLPEGTYYQFQVLGLKVYTTEGDYLGEVVEIISTGSNDVYVVRDGGKELLIPALEDVVKTVDLKEGRMVVGEERMWKPSAWV